ncbi:FecR family protein [Sphingobacterium sp. LRF_L2]|uniref:FecR family protein n=1 Tax=Sphingobacterium sp. LRF_L2 TaxID=3369421 RepID=UPI003F5ED37E
MEKDNLLAKLLDDGLSEREKEKLSADPDYELYQKIKSYTGKLSVPEITDHGQMLQHILENKKVVQKNKTIYFATRWLAAAIVLFALVGGWYFWNQGQVLLTTAGTTMEFELPDASEVLLNNHSTIRYNKAIWSWQRNVHLQGTAYFSVEKGKVFTVVTNLGEVSVLGTRFDVSAKQGKLVVNCYHGKVAVEHGDKQKIIAEGQSLSIEGDNWASDTLFVKEPLWQKKQMAFQSKRLADIVEEMQRAYSLEIDLNVTTFVEGKTFSGALPIDDLQVAIDILEKAFSVKWIKSAETHYQILSR